MPEYLSPGVYVEEVDDGSKAIEGVSTSTAAFLGETTRGPVEPQLITNFGDFKRIYGGSPPDSNMTSAVFGFFQNGGSRCYIARVTPHDPDTVGKTELTRSDNRVMEASAKGPGEWAESAAVVVDDDPRYREGENEYFEVSVRYWDTDREAVNDAASANPEPAPDVEETYTTLTPDQSANNFYEKKLSGSDIVDVSKLGDGRPDAGVFWLDISDEEETDGDDPAADIPGDEELDDLKYNELRELAEPFDIDRTQTKDELKEDLKEIRDARSDGGTQTVTTTQQTQEQGRAEPTLADYEGSAIVGERTGLSALEQVDEISIVVVPDEHKVRGLTEALVAHCEKMGERFAILSSDKHPGRVSELQTPVDSSYAAYYFPWLDIQHPVTGVQKMVPPAGHVAGIYARNDAETGIHGSPANMTVRGAIGLQYDLTKGEQDMLNPRGVNCLRSFKGRGIRVWGARTTSSNPDWQYINVRRLFLYIEQSIDDGTQWAVFEPNTPRTWSQVRQSVSDFLETVYEQGALRGTTTNDAFFVRCGEQTMTENDIDQGRLICEIGVAPVKPAEFVIFRIQQQTEEASS